jgi:hypothetical protein
MRPFKHVAPQQFSGSPARHQDVLAIDLARFRAPWGEVPIVATTERDRITVYYWNDRTPRWEAFERGHEPLSAPGETPAAPTGWNWSDRVAVACSSSTVHVVYKRVVADGDGAATKVVVERYRPRDPTPGATDHTLAPVDARFLPDDAIQGQFEFGRSLWAGCVGETLYVLTQRRLRVPPTPPAEFELTLHTVAFDQVTGSLTETRSSIGDGGYDLDARVDGTTLRAVFRATAEAVRVPMGLLVGAGRRLDGGPGTDPFYEPLRLATVDVTTLDATTETLPGGEHPRIQRVDPLIVTMDRPDLRLSLDPPTLPLPPARPRVVWGESRIDKVAWVRDGGETFRGTLLGSDAATLPRSHAALSTAARLFEDRTGLLAHVAPFPTFPVHVLGTARHEKGLTLDLLHHRDFIGLFRTRLRVDLGGGALTVTDRAFEVWDIGHGQIGDPDALVPSADGETGQFAPTGELPLTASARVILRAVRADNTLGGHLAADLGREPVGFFAYSDLGDGGLRVIFAPDMPALADPPPVEDEKVLRPEQVTGPHLPCDEWIELRAEDWIDAELIGYRVGLVTARRSLGSALEVPIDALRDACEILTANGDGPDGLPLVPEDGLTRPQLRAVDTFRNGPVPATVLSLTAADGRAVTVAITPGTIVTAQPMRLALDVGGAATPAMWTFIRLSPAATVPAGPLFPGTLPELTTLVGNPVDRAFERQGVWRVSVFLLDVAARPGATVDVTVQPSTYELLTAIYDQVARGQFHRIDDLDASLLQYDFRYGVSGDPPPVRISITPREVRPLEVRFRGAGLGQGVVESRTTFAFSTDEVRLRRGLDLLFAVTTLAFTLRYGRAFTPGMLMTDRRSRSPLTGEPLDEPGDTVLRQDATRHAGIGAKPVGDAGISARTTIVDVAMTPAAITISAVIAALTVIGAAGAIATILGLLGLIAAATIVGVAGVVVAAIAAITLALYVAFGVPPLVEAFIVSQIDAAFTSGEVLDGLNDQPIVRFSGEGTAEAVARMALARAHELHPAVPGPQGADADDVGLDRTRGQLFQMIFVSDKVCRVLVRIDDCDPTS